MRQRRSYICMYNVANKIQDAEIMQDRCRIEEIASRKVQTRRWTRKMEKVYSLYALFTRNLFNLENTIRLKTNLKKKIEKMSTNFHVNNVEI